MVIIFIDKKNYKLISLFLILFLWIFKFLKKIFWDKFFLYTLKY
jgi:hypothetical protein